MQVTITSTPQMEYFPDHMDTDRMTFKFRKEDSTHEYQAEITGQFRMEMPITGRAGDTIDLGFDGTGFWDEDSPSLFRIYWDQPPDETRAVGIIRETFAETAAQKAAAAALAAHEAATADEDLDPDQARHLLRVMAHHLQDASRDLEVLDQ